MDASFICLFSGGSQAPTPTSPQDHGCSPSFSDGSGLGEWGWGFGDFDADAADMPPSKTYTDDAAGRRERLDDLGAEIAAARARLGELR